MIDPFHYLIAEKVSDTVIFLRDYYERNYGCLSEWDEFTDDVFFLNCDVNIEAFINKQGGYIHPKSLDYGVSRGVMAVHFDEESFFHIMEHAEEPMDYDTRAVCYDNTIERISNFLFDFKE